MNNAPLALAGVTAVLQHYLGEVFPSAELGGDVKVSAVAPDIIQASANNGQEKRGVNLFLHQVTINAAYRNVEMPSVASDGVTRLSNQPLALDLHYLLTAYAQDDSLAEALLGIAVFFLHQNPVIRRADITDALTHLTGPQSTYPPAYATALADCGLSDQAEMIKISPATLGREEMAWLWTALKADYRPTFPFQASVVLMQPQNAVVSALPVLRRIIDAKPFMHATLTQASAPNKQPAATLGDAVTLTGSSLGGATSVRLFNARAQVQRDISPLASATATSISFDIPNPTLPPPQTDPSDLPAGVYLVSALLTADTDTVETNGVPLAIAPKVVSAPATLASGKNVKVGIECSPYIRPGQQASLIIGSQQGPADPITTPTNNPSFTFEALQATGADVPLRIRVDGIDSSIATMNTKLPKFSGPFMTVT